MFGTEDEAGVEMTALIIWLVNILVVGWCCGFLGYLLGVSVERKRWRSMKIQITMGSEPLVSEEEPHYNVVEGHQEDE
jgi:hypothetical protein